jgi:hypothetical protein
LVVNVPRVTRNATRIILKSAKPALASEPPTRFEAVIKSQDPEGGGLIPPSLLQRADQVIE